jgi:hypothetical protein
MVLSSRAHELLRAFAEPGCPVCRLTLASVHHYLWGLVYEYVNKPPTHFAVRDARGFCATHAWHVQEQINASGLGVAVLYEGLIRNLMNDMGTVEPDSGRRQVVAAANALKPRADCPACIHRETTENHLLRNLLEHLHQDDFTQGFAASAGICLPHLRQALAQPGQMTAKASLLAIQQDIWTRLQADLTEYIRKNDHRFVTEEMGVEGDSPRRAIESVSGSKEIR